MNDHWIKIVTAIIAGGVIALQTSTSVRLNEADSMIYPKPALEARHEAHDKWRDEIEARVRGLEQQQMIDVKINEQFLEMKGE